MYHQQPAANVYIFSGTVKFTVNGKDFEYDFSGADKNKTIQNILDDISSKAGVKASLVN